MVDTDTGRSLNVHRRSLVSADDASEPDPRAERHRG